MFSRDRAVFFHYQVLLYASFGVIIGLILIVAYVRNDQLYHVTVPPSPGYPLLLAHSDLRENLPPDTYSQDIEEGLRIYSNTYWSYEINFPETGPVPIYMTARGTPLKGKYPLVTFTLDYNLSGLLNIDSHGWKTFELTLFVPAGKHILTVAFVNDAFQYPEDRNLDIRALSIGARHTSSSKNKARFTANARKDHSAGNKGNE